MCEQPEAGRQDDHCAVFEAPRAKSRQRALSGEIGRSHACDVSGEDVDAVAIEVAACVVAVLGGAWIGGPGKDLGVTQRHTGAGPGIRALFPRVQIAHRAQRGRPANRPSCLGPCDSVY